MRKFLLFLLLLTAAVAQAQNLTVSGKILDNETKEGVGQATIQLLQAKDSSFVSGAVSSDGGVFSVKAPSDGKYLIKISSVGYRPVFKPVTLADGKNVTLDDIALHTDSKLLKGVTVTGQAAKVTVREDTFIYNAAAYRTPEGSTIEELVKRLPGAKVDDDGNITINGKTVKKIMVDGKEFMTGDTKTAMKNLPTSIVQKVKAYDQKSDLSRVTGIDDGNEETVLDFGLKEGMHRGFFSNTDLAAGTHDRYAGRIMGAYFNQDWRVMAFGNANNINDRGFGGRGGGFGRGRAGLEASKMVGVNINYEKKDLLKADGSVRWNHNDGDRATTSSSENFVSTVGSFSNSKSQSYSRSDSWDARGRIEWTPDTMTNIMFRPSFSYSASDGLSASRSASFNRDPYLYVTDPLNELDELATDSAIVNSNLSRSISWSKSTSLGGMLQYNRKLGSNGRNFTLRADASYSDNQSRGLSINDVHLYQMQTALGLDSTYQTNRYNLTPTRNYSYSGQATWSEPLWKATFLQFSYKFTYGFSKSDRSTYDFSNLGESFFDGVPYHYRGWDGYLSRLDNPYEDYLDDDLSRYSEYKTYTHDINVTFRMIRSNFNFNAGFMIQPQMTKFIQDYQGVYTDTVRHVVNFSPTLDFRYRFNKQKQLRVMYRGSTSQPSMSQLLDITDDSDPLNISKGNPGLKPAFTQSLRAFYRNFVESHYRFIEAHGSFSTTRNSISNRVTYNETTGGRTTRPENINGNWNANGGFTFNTSVDSAGYWNANTSTDISYANNVSYLSLRRDADSEKNITRNLTVGERLAGSYRNDWLEVELDGSLNYTHARNKLQSNSDLDTWQFAYGINVNLTAPWGMSLSTDLHESSRRGYNDASLNTNELVWNAQLAQSFLKGKNLTVSLQLYDILHNQSNLSRTINAYMRQDTEYNSINSFAMLHVIYRFNLFGGKQNRPDGPDGPGNRRGRGQFRGGGPGGPPPGGFGGGRF